MHICENVCSSQIVYSLILDHSLKTSQHGLNLGYKFIRPSLCRTDMSILIDHNIKNLEDMLFLNDYLVNEVNDLRIICKDTR